MPSLNSLRALEVVARHKSYQRAAEELHVTPAAVKQLIVKLEKAIGKRLVRRDGRSITLTETAISGAGELKSAMRHMNNAVEKMRDIEEAERLIITVEASFATTWLVPRLEDFRSRNPGISVLIDSAQRIVDLEHSSVDIAIRYGVKPDDRLVTHRLFKDFVYPACSPSLAPKLSSIHDLEQAPLIHWDMAQFPWAVATRHWFDWGEWVQQLGLTDVDVTKGLRFSDYGLAVQAATSGQGVILASWPILQDSFDAGLLVRLFPESVRSTGIGYDLVTTQSARQRPAVVAFTEWLIETAKQVSV